MNSHRVKIFHVANNNTIVRPIPHHLILHLLPSFQILLNKNLGSYRKSLRRLRRKFFASSRNSRPLSSKRESRPHHNRISKPVSGKNRLLYSANRVTLGSLHSNLFQTLSKKIAVFRIANRGNRRPQNPHLIFFQHLVLLQREPEIQSRLPAKTQKNPIWPLFFNDSRSPLLGKRQKICLVGKMIIRLHGSDVRIH